MWTTRLYFFVLVHFLSNTRLLFAPAQDDIFTCDFTFSHFFLNNDFFSASVIPRGNRKSRRISDRSCSSVR